jgi:hypothetical protein
MPRFSKRRTSINRRTRRKGRRTGRSRRGGDGERDAITIHDNMVLNDVSSALDDSRNPEKVPSRVWNKFPNNPFETDDDRISEEYRQRLLTVKGGKTKKKMRKHRK